MYKDIKREVGKIAMNVLMAIFSLYVYSLSYLPISSICYSS